MVKVSRPRADRKMIHCLKTHQNTDCIARTARNVLICRAFVRSVLPKVYRPLVDPYRPPS
jgi:hypothetical protein